MNLLAYELFGVVWWLIAALVASFIGLLYTVDKEKPGWATGWIIVAIATLQYNHIIDLRQFTQINILTALAFTGGYIIIGTVWAVSRWRILVYDWAGIRREAIRQFRALLWKKPFIDSLKQQPQFLSAGDDDAKLWSTFVDEASNWLSGFNKWQYNARVSEEASRDREVGRARLSNDVKEAVAALAGINPLDDIFGPYHDAIKAILSEESNTAPHPRDHVNRLVIWGCYWPASMLWHVLDNPLARLWRWLLFGVLGGILSSFSRSAADSVAKELRSPKL